MGLGASHPRFCNHSKSRGARGYTHDQKTQGDTSQAQANKIQGMPSGRISLCREVMEKGPGYPLSGCKLNWYTDGSSFFQDGARRAGAAVVDQEGNTVWSSALPPRTSAQKAELIALAEALERAKGKRVNIYTDSRYAFGTIHVHGAIYRERGFRTAEGKHLKNLAKVQRLLMAVEKPKAVAVMYVPGHQSAKMLEAVGNNRADQEAKRVAMVSPPMETGQPSTVAAIDVPVPELPPLPPPTRILHRGFHLDENPLPL
ncbi:ribonuclease H-like [Castor canadensis]|uniref:Ribonuclease H-like n=1 Tax=Castor canadensis TaxID=51338 RepID=A0AC58KQD6_CASCN